MCPGCGTKVFRAKFSATTCDNCGRTTARNCGADDDFHDAVKEAVVNIKNKGFAFFKNKQIYHELCKMGYQKDDIKTHDVSSAMRYHWHEIPGLMHMNGRNGYYTWEAKSNNVNKEAQT